MELNDVVDDLGQQPGLQIYTQICFCFSVSDASTHRAIVKTLTNGLERLSASFPWIAGQVVNEGSKEGNTGTFKIKPLERISRLVVKDLRSDASVPTMDALRRANFPISMLDESITAPRRTLPESSEETIFPVFALQATFITDGLLLTFVGQHQTMDMTGQGHIIYLFSKACSKLPFTSEELLSGNLARQNLIPLLDSSYKQGPELDLQIVKSPSAQNISDGLPLPSCSWTSFTFSATALNALKLVATNTIPLNKGYISTDDALSAFIWQSVVRARKPRLNPSSEVTFARAVDVRRYLHLPDTYPGLMQNMTYHAYTLPKLVEESLGGVASQLRSAVDPKISDLEYRTRALATFLDRSPDKNVTSFTATLDLGVDVMLSSWAKLNSYELDFNLGLGTPEAVRRPQFVPVESLIYLLPKSLDGEIAVAICLRDEDIERLKKDEEFAKYGQHIG